MAARNGWIVTFASALAMIVGSGPIVVYTQGSFLRPLTAEFHWSRVQYFLPYTLAGLAGALALPVLGYLADRFGTRRVLLIGIVTFAVASASLATLSGSPLQYAVLMIIVGVAAMSQSNLLYAKMVSSWIDLRRGLALAIVISGFGLGGMIVPPLTAALISAAGWRIARLGLSAAILLVALPAVYFFVFDRPRSGTLAVSSTAAAGTSTREALRTVTLWNLFLAFFFGTAAATAVVTNLVPLLGDHGISAKGAAWALSLVAAGQFLGRLLSGYLLDKVSSPKIGLIWFVCAIAGVLVISRADRLSLAALGSALVGIGYGAEGELAAYFTGRYFGLKNFATIYAIVVAAVIVGAAIGPLSTGYLFDHYGGYAVSLGVIEAALAIAAVCIALLGGYVYKPSAN
jgi:MFS family permease